MKTAISLPDELFDQVEQAAKRLGVSRNELFTRAVEKFLDVRLPANITRSYDLAFGDGDEAHLLAFRPRATRQALLDVEWEQ
jgi:hypothetical protein